MNSNQLRELLKNRTPEELAAMTMRVQEPRNELAGMMAPEAISFDGFVEQGPQQGEGYMTGSDGSRITFGRKVSDAPMQPQMQRQAPPVQVMGDNGRNLGVSQEEPDIDFSRSQVSIGGLGKGYYSKDGSAAYIPSQNGYKKVLLGFNEDAYQQNLDRDLRRQAQQANIAQSQEAIEASRQSRTQRERAKPIWDSARGVFIDPETQTATAPTMGGKPLLDKQEMKPLNESQGKAMGFGTRMAEAHEILDSVGQDGKVQPSLLRRTAEEVPLIGGALAMAANAAASPRQQQVEQAQRNFINAVLRRESGAVISPVEFANAAQQYFPQPNDDAHNIAQKKRARETAIENFAIEAGPGSQRVFERLKTGQAKSQALSEARQAIGRGADRAKVIQRLKAAGINEEP